MPPSLFCSILRLVSSRSIWRQPPSLWTEIQEKVSMKPVSEPQRKWQSETWPCQNLARKCHITIKPGKYYPLLDDDHSLGLLTEWANCYFFNSIGKQLRSWRAFASPSSPSKVYWTVYWRVIRHSIIAINRLLYVNLGISSLSANLF